MKNFNNSTKENKNLEILISKLSENNMLSLQAMSNVKGGEGTGTEPGTFPPTKP
jgi:hypothetical protein